MTQKIIVISGRKQSGKTSLANFIHGYQLLRNDIIQDFDLSDKGEILAPASYIDAEGQKVEGKGVIDLTRHDPEFIEYALVSIWPHVKLYNFADRLKQALMVIFGVTQQQLFGTDDQKNTPISIKWKDLKFLLSDEKKAELDKVVVKDNFTRKDRWDDHLTARDLAQVFGSDVCRKIMNNCWVEACYSDIVMEDYPLVIIADARFPNELDFMKERGAKLIRLTRNPHNDNHISETALDSYPVENYDLVIDNANMTLKEKNQKMLSYLLSIGWVDSLPE